MTEKSVFEELDFLFDASQNDVSKNLQNATQTVPTNCQSAKKRRRLAERIADNDDLVRQINQLRANQQQLEDLQRTGREVTELYQQEKKQRSELEERLKEQRERCSELEKQLDVKQLTCEQLQEELETKGLPVNAKDMISIFMQLTQRMKDDSNVSGLLKREISLIRKLKDYCRSANISIPPPSIKSPPSKRLKTTAVTQATQTEALPEPPKMCSIGVQSKNLKATRDQGTQHKNTTTTRGTTTASFIKMHDVGTCFPEPKPPLSAYQILDKMLSWNKTPIRPLSPILDDTPTEMETTSIGTCTDLCNVQRVIDYLPDLPSQLKLSNSRPPSRGSVKDEISNTGGSYGTHMAKELLNILPQNQSIMANLPPHVFEEIWQVMGQMVLVVLQRRSSNSSLATSQPTPAPTISQADFSSWFDAIYESSVNQTQSSKGKQRCRRSLDIQLQSNLFTASDFDTTPTGVDVGTDPISDPPTSPPAVGLELTPIRLPIKSRIRDIAKPKRKPKKKQIKRIKHNTMETAVNFLSTLNSFHNPNCDSLDIELDEEERKLLQLTTPAESSGQLNSSATVEELPMSTAVVERLTPPKNVVDLLTKSASGDEQPIFSTVRTEKLTMNEMTGEQLATTAERVKQPMSSALRVEQPTSAAVRVGQLTMSTESSEQLATSAKRVNQPTIPAQRVEQLTSPAVSVKQLTMSSDSGGESAKSAARVDQPTLPVQSVEQSMSSALKMEQQTMSLDSGEQPERVDPPTILAQRVEESTSSAVRVGQLTTTPNSRVDQPTLPAQIFEQFTTSLTIPSELPASAATDQRELSSPAIFVKPWKSTEKTEPVPDMIENVLAKPVPVKQPIDADGNESDTDSLYSNDLIIDYNEQNSPSDTETIGLPEPIQNYQPILTPIVSPIIAPIVSPTLSPILPPTLSPILPSASKRKRKTSSSSSDSPQPVVKRLTRLQAKKLLNWASETNVESNEEVKNPQPNFADISYSPMSPVGPANYEESDSKPIEIPLDTPGGAQNSSEPQGLLSYIIKQTPRLKNTPLKSIEDPPKQLQKKISNYLMNSVELKSTTIANGQETFFINAITQTIKGKELDAVEGDVLDRLLSLVRQCESQCNGFIQQFMNMLERRLFHPKDRIAINVAKKYIRLYLELTSLQASLVVPGENYANPARLILMKILYHYKNDMPLLVLDVLCHFPTVLPHREERSYDHSDPIITVIKHLLMNTVYDITNPSGPDRALLSKLRFEYHYNVFEPTRDQVIENLVDKLKVGRLDQLCYAFALLCKRSPMPMVNNLLNAHLVPLANSYCDLSLQSEEYDERLVCLLQCISMIVKQLPLNLKPDMKLYTELFDRLLVAAPRAAVQEAAVQAILRIQRFSFPLANSALKNYRPNYPPTAMTRAMLRSFAKRRYNKMLENKKRK